MYIDLYTRVYQVCFKPKYIYVCIYMYICIYMHLICMISMQSHLLCKGSWTLWGSAATAICALSLAVSISILDCHDHLVGSNFEATGFEERLHRFLARSQDPESGDLQAQKLTVSQSFSCWMYSKTRGCCSMSLLLGLLLCMYYKNTWILWDRLFFPIARLTQTFNSLAPSA